MDDTTFQVLVNDEEQYSLWPADKEVPAGWRPDGTRGTRQECMDHVDEVWTDMRPRSLRERMAAGGSGQIQDGPRRVPEGVGDLS